MDDWDDWARHACWGWEWVCGIGETLAMRISIHYKIALPSFILSAHLHMQRLRIRLTQDDAVAAASTHSRTDLSSTV